jgi:hypothetical protein
MPSVSRLSSLTCEFLQSPLTKGIGNLPHFRGGPAAKAHHAVQILNPNSLQFSYTALNQGAPSLNLQIYRRQKIPCHQGPGCDTVISPLRYGLWVREEPTVPASSCICQTMSSKFSLLSIYGLWAREVNQGLRSPLCLHPLASATCPQSLLPQPVALCKHERATVINACMKILEDLRQQTRPVVPPEQGEHLLSSLAGPECAETLIEWWSNDPMHWDKKA